MKLFLIMLLATLTVSARPADGLISQRPHAPKFDDQIYTSAFIGCMLGYTINNNLNNDASAACKDIAKRIVEKLNESDDE